ncbi:MAG: hypothetical protein ACN6O9_13315, partial [Agrobacterium tumefaciens]
LSAMKMLDTLKRSIGRQNNRDLAHLMGREYGRGRPTGEKNARLVAGRFLKISGGAQAFP